MVTFKENPNNTDHSKIRIFDALGINIFENRDRNITGKIGIAQGGKNLILLYGNKRVILKLLRILGPL